jgi:hypothetical protein
VIEYQVVAYEGVKRVGTWRAVGLPSAMDKAIELFAGLWMIPEADLRVETETPAGALEFTLTDRPPDQPEDSGHRVAIRFTRLIEESGGG